MVVFFAPDIRFPTRCQNGMVLPFPHRFFPIQKLSTDCDPLTFEDKMST